MSHQMSQFETSDNEGMTKKPSDMPHLTTLMCGDETPRKALLTALGVGTY